MPYDPSLARALGQLSLASGIALLITPRPLGRLFGLPPRPSLLRALGVRDVAIGAGLLGGGRRRAWLVARAASDALDAALIARASKPGARAKTWARVAVALGSSALSLTLVARS
ncbi:MAG TPA: hypothetical protein VFS43_23180 [Polyangiaceae bacterium]|nr:hypothetical protein [Polyangiaceae bacterium]